MQDAMTPPRQIVLDTNVLISALRSKRGASFRLLSLVGVTDRFEINVSVPLVLEYEDVARRQAGDLELTHREIDEILDSLCAAANRREIFFLWRPFLKDPKDDLVLELAVEAGVETIVTYNLRDFAGIEQFGLRALTPLEFLRSIGEIQ